MIEYRKFITRQMLRDEPEKLFVFGDNFGRVGLGGQAKEMRGEPNAIGIITKQFPSMVPAAFLTDADYENWKNQIRSDVTKLLNFDNAIVWPSAGIGTGLAKLNVYAPLIFNSIEALRYELERT